MEDGVEIGARAAEAGLDVPKDAVIRRVAERFGPEALPGLSAVALAGHANDASEEILSTQDPKPGLPFQRALLRDVILHFQLASEADAPPETAPSEGWGEASATAAADPLRDIRGIRSGLPVVEGIATVGREFGPPIGGHFAAVAERVKLGQPLDQSLGSVARILQRPEMDFFAVCISIQMETGGSLSDALEGLADLLRKRQQMRQKVKAISSEAKASALIIGALPFLMLGLLSIMAPDYVAPLFTDPRGQVLLAVGFCSIAIGAYVMWRMTQFEI